MKKRVITLSALAILLQACGGQDQDQQVAFSSQSRIAGKLAGPEVQLDRPLTSQAIDSQMPGATQSQHKQSALIVGGTSYSVDTSDREAVRLFFNRVYKADDIPMNWTGDYRSGNPGSINPAYQEATIKRINWYRAMAGLPIVSNVSDSNSSKNQAAALMMSVNGQLSHHPPSTWKFYTAAGAEAASSSNIALTVNGPDAIDAYISDPGEDNYPVGHRRWLLFPATRSYGTGDVPPATVDGTKFMGANAVWITDTDRSGTRPTVRDDFVAWPARGYAPYPVVFSRWSFSYPNADFTGAVVDVTRDGSQVQIAQQKVENGYGENTVAWRVSTVPTDRSHARPETDIRYHVRVSGVRIAQQQRSFEYDVIVFDPAIAAAGAAQPQLSAPSVAHFGSAYQVQVSPMPGATGYQISAFQRTPLLRLTSTDYNSATWTAGSPSSPATIGNGVLNLYEDGQATKQTALLNKILWVPQTGGAVSFVRSAGPAQASQTFHVQVSKDDGSSWVDAFSEVGKGLTSTPAGTIRVPLDAYAGRPIRLRMTETNSGSAYIGAGTGWTIKDIAFEGIDELANPQAYSSADGNFVIQAAQAGNYVLVPKVQYQGLYLSDSGIPALVVVDGVTFHGPRSSYTITKQNGVVTVRDNVGTDGVQTFRDPFRFDFTDSTVAFDVEGNAGKVYRLYRAAFNRVPDQSGLGFWVRAADSGLPIESMAREFIESPEFATLYGAKPTDAEVITALYKNVLHRAPDEAGAAFWLNALAVGVSRQHVLYEFSESPENKNQVSSEVALGITYTRM